MISFYCRANNREKMSIYLKKTLDWLAVSSRLLSFSGLLTFSFKGKNSRRAIHFAAICLGVDVCWLVFSQLWTKDGPGRDGARWWRFKSGKWRRHRVDSDESSYLTRELLEGLGYGSVNGRSVAMDEKNEWKEERRKIVVSQHTSPSQFSIKKHFPAPILHYPQPTKNRSQRSRFPIPTTCVFSQGSTASEDNRWKSNRHWSTPKRSTTRKTKT